VGLQRLAEHVSQLKGCARRTHGKRWVAQTNADQRSWHTSRAATRQEIYAGGYGTEELRAALVG